jgi:hypothetical protein
LYVTIRNAFVVAAIGMKPHRRGVPAHVIARAKTMSNSKKGPT